MDLVYMAGGMLLTALVLAYTCFSAHLLSCQVMSPGVSTFFSPRLETENVAFLESFPRNGAAGNCQPSKARTGPPDWSRCRQWRQYGKRLLGDDRRMNGRVRVTRVSRLTPPLPRRIYLRRS